MSANKYKAKEQTNRAKMRLKISNIAHHFILLHIHLRICETINNYFGFVRDSHTHSHTHIRRLYSNKWTCINIMYRNHWMSCSATIIIKTYNIMPCSMWDSRNVNFHWLKLQLVFISYRKWLIILKFFFVWVDSAKTTEQTSIHEYVWQYGDENENGDYNESIRISIWLWDNSFFYVNVHSVYARE